MSELGDEYTKEEILSLLKEKGYNGPIIEWFDKCIDFHTFPAAGLLIGIFMVDKALDLLGAKPGEKLYAVCETTKCAPDPLQVITHCTTGNHRLNVIPIGRFAITVNRPSTGDNAEGFRVKVDPAKLVDTPILEAWFANTPKFDGMTMKKKLVEDILDKGTGMLSWEKVRILVSHKKKWKTVICSLCGEPVPDNMVENGLCPGCGSQKYYEKI
ncbi:formylmethanofuran dehydrogenase [Methanospirillum sp. J.3.6.1-F.2.7.3]|jgi:formylmethanofuran dehydrogenase subunit E|uniref:Formylmethanofuran dehydrogenase n=2 Tax=Methanospirillum TaxID=2202 RepID=A0A8E7B173_9EURY|nr:MULTISPECIES: FmdE family protein [Methanospirillum]MDX8548819.1 FmdE family protein [Methanospirillum hungatei]QVV88517.1 formylmethanofuran dehydrogenase [Methanospirillum sp. J.3.6.1-F.2.7.3]QXO94112.1 formylmethanofuran dehydrogenase [Methanospirillum hungatei]